MKRYLAMMFAAALLLAVACGGGGESSYYTEEEAPAGTTPATADAGTQAAAPAAAMPADAGSIAGTIKLVGTPPAEPVIAMSADPVCEAHHDAPVHVEEVVVGPDGGLQNVFVYIKDYKGPIPAPTGEAEIDQQGCEYVPHVLGVQVGETLKIKNTDGTLHNVHALAKNNPEFNIGQPVQGMVSEKTFDKPEVMIKFKCDVHAWMNAWVGVVPHPFFAVSDNSGNFTIKGVPPGTYTIEAWHEKYGTQTQQVTVGANGTADVALSYNAS